MDMLWSLEQALDHFLAGQAGLRDRRVLGAFLQIAYVVWAGRLLTVLQAFVTSLRGFAWLLK
jgi:hypothetical protein